MDGFEKFESDIELKSKGISGADQNSKVMSGSIKQAIENKVESLYATTIMGNKVMPPTGKHLNPFTNKD